MPATATVPTSAAMRPCTTVAGEAAVPGESTVPGESAMPMAVEPVPSDPVTREAAMPVSKTVTPVVMKPAKPRGDHDSPVSVVAVVPVVVGFVTDGFRRASRHGKTDAEQQKYRPRHYPAATHRSLPSFLLLLAFITSFTPI